MLQAHQVRIALDEVDVVALLGHDVLNHLVVFLALLEQLLQSDLRKAQELREGLLIKLLVRVTHVPHLETRLLEILDDWRISSSLRLGLRGTLLGAEVLLLASPS